MAAEEEEAAEISVHGWRFLCLVRKGAPDILRAHLTIPPFPQEALDLSFPAPVISRDGVCGTAPARYSALRNEFIAAQNRFTDDFDMVLYRDETTAGSVYVTEYLSRKKTQVKASLDAGRFSCGSTGL